jgi:hypothetical protein
VTHWSARLLAAELKIGFATVPGSGASPENSPRS